MTEQLSLFYQVLDSHIAAEFTLRTAAHRVQAIAEWQYNQTVRMARAVRIGAWGEGDIPYYNEIMAAEAQVRQRNAQTRSWVLRVLTAQAQSQGENDVKRTNDAGDGSI